MVGRKASEVFMALGAEMRRGWVGKHRNNISARKKYFSETRERFPRAGKREHRRTDSEVLG